MGGGNTPNEGYVEALGSNDRWGGICDDGWDINNAKVVCKMLGYPTAEQFFKEARFGQAPSGGRFVLDNLRCTGSESSVFDCPHPGEWSEDCGASEIAGVRCGNVTQQVVGTTTSSPERGERFQSKTVLPHIGQIAH